MLPTKALTMGVALTLTLSAGIAAAAPPAERKSTLAKPAPTGALVAQATPPSTGPASGELTGLLAMNALVGNTLVINDPEAELETAIYFLPDGTAKGMTGQQPRTGTWYITGTKLCIRDGEKNLSPRDCVAFVVTGDSVSIAGPRDRTLRGQILKGNPRNL